MRADPAALARRLLEWYRAGRRDLPWRGTQDPYRVWISEVMLQQTRVEAVIPHYEQFLRRYPSVGKLAAASEQELLAAWGGLGYYRRARHLHVAARRILDDFGGRFPSDYAALRRLPGIGDYTAAAVASIAFDQPRAALDGNALRVLARLEDERRDIATAAAKAALRARAQGLVETVGRGERGDFAQALMELGATLCVARVPRCLSCPWRADCLARATGSAPGLPTKRTHATTRRVALAIAVVRRTGGLLVRQRPPDATVMPGFWELPAVEAAPQLAEALDGLVLRWLRKVGSFSHGITSTSYACSVYLAEARGEPSGGYRWTADGLGSGLPLTTISRKALRMTERAADEA